MARYIEAVKTADIISEKINIPLGDLVDVFAEIPTANVEEVRHGEWHYCKNGGFKCTACGGWTDDYYGASPKYMSFCPKCGAKMDGGKTE